MSAPQGAKETQCDVCGYTYGTHDKDCPKRILEDMATNGCSMSTREAFTTEHDPARMLKDGLFRHRKVLGSLHIEWVQATHAEFAIDQLTAMYRDACADRRNAIAEIERVNHQLKLAGEQLERSKRVMEMTREQMDKLRAEGLALKRSGESLKRKLRSMERSGRRK